MREYTDNELIKMTKEELETLYKEMESEQSCLTLSLQSKLQKFNGLARTLKGHGSDYQTFQRESYDLCQEIKQLKGKSGSFMVNYVLLKRRWETLHNLNQVKEFKQLDNGKTVLV